VILRFSKYEGLGNDFLVVREDDASRLLSPAIVARLCDRNFGVGADGVLIVGRDGDMPAMRVINADGSEPEMCGNGLRCVALFLVEQGLASTVGPHSELVVQTGAGPHPVSVDSSVKPAQVRVHMRPASLLAGEVLRDGQGEWVEKAFEGSGPRLTMVSMGNPHAVTFDPVADMPRLGPLLEKDVRFRAGANIGFARLKAPTRLDLTVWERGVGFTRACGTGACAAAVAAVETGRSPRGEELQVCLPGGPLRIRVRERADPIEMTGPARHVFEGQVSLQDFGAPA